MWPHLHDAMALIICAGAAVDQTSFAGMGWQQEACCGAGGGGGDGVDGAACGGGGGDGCECVEQSGAERESSVSSLTHRPPPPSQPSSGVSHVLEVRHTGFGCEIGRVARCGR
jgi:hypothetical protein